MQDEGVGLETLLCQLRSDGYFNKIGVEIRRRSWHPQVQVMAFEVKIGPETRYPTLRFLCVMPDGVNHLVFARFELYWLDRHLLVDHWIPHWMIYWPQTGSGVTPS